LTLRISMDIKLAMDAGQFIKVSKALSDPQRLAMLERIAAAGPGELACKELVRTCDVVPATVSHHLKELQNAGLVVGRKEGQAMFLSFRADVLEAYRRELSRRLSPEGSGGSNGRGKKKRVKRA
jgi:ArsR family transcriptional regulator